MTLGSLFDGSGGFPLAGVINGICPAWSSEIEPYPMRVTAKRFPNMKQLGDVTKINGAEIEPVDIITFGSPCQDLSVAGAQKGIHDGARSSLFFEAIRIIKEMRANDTAAGRTDKHIRPRFAVWENVPGAFSSNKGQDFKAVLQAFCEVCGEAVSVPEPPKGKWANAGCIVGDGYSVAWRVYDAQYWGVPQRRKRIYLIADFASERAGEILFESEGVRGNPAQGEEAREGTPEDAEGSAGRGCGAGVVYALQANGIDRADTAGCNGSGWRVGGCYTLNMIDRHAVAYAAGFNDALGERSTGSMEYSEECAPTLRAGDARVVVYDCRGNGSGGVTPTLTGDHQNRVTDYTSIAVCAGNGQLNQISMAQQSNTLDCMHDQQIIVKKADKPPRKYIVRRLTPLECCRLQGFPDWWEDGVEGSDSARYKMWGNGIALPCAVDVLRRIVKEKESC